MTVPLLTLVTNRHTARLTLPVLVRAAVAGGVDVVQVRERDLPARQLHALVADLVEAVGATHVAINDAPEVAESLGIHLHLPERSISGFVGRVDSGTVSCSVHSVEAIDRVPGEATYVIAGHLFPTETHADAEPLGMHGFGEIVRGSKTPVVAIGGVTPANAGSALEAGAGGVAVMSYVNSSDRPEVAARELRDALERAMQSQPAAVTLQVNGRPMSIKPDTTLTSFLERRNLHPRLVVVERNREIVAKSAYDSTVLEEGDLLEIAHFVGGG